MTFASVHHPSGMCLSAYSGGTGFSSSSSPYSVAPGNNRMKMTTTIAWATPLNLLHGVSMKLPLYVEPISISGVLLSFPASYLAASQPPQRSTQANSTSTCRDPREIPACCAHSSSTSFLDPRLLYPQPL